MFGGSSKLGPAGRWAKVLTPVIIGAGLMMSVGCADRNTGGLDAIRERGVIRIGVRPGFLASPAPPSGEGDFKTGLTHLAARLGVEIEWLEFDRHDELIPGLEEGLCDLVASRLSPSVLIATDTAATAPVEWVAEFLVAGNRNSGLTREDLRGGRIHLRLSELSPGVREAIAELGMVVTAAPEGQSAEELLAMVARGEIPATVVDSGLLERFTDAGKLQVFGPLVERRPVVWAVRRSNLQLRRAIDDFLFAEKVLTRESRVRACRDLDAIRMARILRVVTRNSPTTCFVSRGGLEGFEYELAVAFARRQRLRLELSIPPPGVDPLDWLERGFGDIAVLHEPIAPSRAGYFAISEPYRRVDMVSVVSQRIDAAVSFDDLAGREMAASSPVAEMMNEFPPEAGLNMDGSAPDLDAFGAIRSVLRGDAFAAVVDEDACRVEVNGRDDLQIGPTVLTDIPLVWVLNPSSPGLRVAVNDFLREARSTGLVSQLTQKNLGTWKLHVSPRMPDVPDGDLTPYDEYVTWAARQYGLDWRLLASLMYEESRFDPDAVGPGGSAGLFQFMPFTWRELGVEDPHHPGEAIEAGARYLSSLMEKFGDLDLPDRVAMAIASYNVGPRHVFDARRLAVEMNLDPDRWSNNVETAMYILDDPEVARRYPAGVCRCRRGAAYTRRILRRYAAYAEQFPPA